MQFKDYMALTKIFSSYTYTMYIKQKKSGEITLNLTFNKYEVNINKTK